MWQSSIRQEPGDDREPARRVDRLGVAMALVTLTLVAGAAWLRFGRPALAEPLSVGAAMPPLKVQDLETSEPRLLLGSRGRITWIVFWSADDPAAAAGLARLEPSWKRLKSHRGFSMLTASVDDDGGRRDRARASLAGISSTVPAYAATRQVLERFGTDTATPPLQVLIDGDGRIAAMVRGTAAAAIRRLEGQAEAWLEEADPLGATRFARAASRAPAPAHPLEAAPGRG